MQTRKEYVSESAHTYEQAKAMAQAQPFEVHYHPHINVDVTPSWDNLNYEHCTMDDGACISSGVSALYYH